MVTLHGGTATFDDKNVGTGKTVTLTGVDAGGRRGGQLRARRDGDDDGGHHGGTVTRQLHGGNKVYDGTTAATV